MINLIKNELFKLSKRKILFWFYALTLIVMGGYVIATKNLPFIFRVEEMLSTGYSSFSWVNLNILITAGTIISQEFRDGTILLLLNKRKSKLEIFVSKVLSALFLSLISYVFFMTLSICISFTLGINLTWSLIGNVLKSSIGFFLMLWLLLSFIVLLSLLIERGSIIVALSIILHFSSSTLAMFNSYLVTKAKVLRFSPINLLNIRTQLNAYDRLMNKTYLSDVEMVIYSIIYIIIFLLLAYKLFENKEIE